MHRSDSKDVAPVSSENSDLLPVPLPTVINNTNVAVNIVFPPQPPPAPKMTLFDLIKYLFGKRD